MASSSELGALARRVRDSNGADRPAADALCRLLLPRLRLLLLRTELLAVPVELADIERVDIDYCTPEGELLTVFPDVPIEPSDTELLIACDRHIASAHDAIRFRIRGSKGETERVLADWIVRTVR